MKRIRNTLTLLVATSLFSGCGCITLHLSDKPTLNQEPLYKIEDRGHDLRANVCYSTKDILLRENENPEFSLPNFLQGDKAKHALSRTLSEYDMPVMPDEMETGPPNQILHDGRLYLCNTATVSKDLLMDRMKKGTLNLVLKQLIKEKSE